MKQVTFTKFTSTIQRDDLSKIRDLFATPLKLLRVPQGYRDPQFENHFSKIFSSHIYCIPKKKIDCILGSSPNFCFVNLQRFNLSTKQKSLK